MSRITVKKLHSTITAISRFFFPSKKVSWTKCECWYIPLYNFGTIKESVLEYGQDIGKKVVKIH